mmetsp:Transcript_2253/g.6443  ORF Transcript_2253/g.6443 Transcript_2253/m.6443 type:complete len:265 (-) Transcript_2253:929-1723(-)
MLPRHARVLADLRKAALLVHRPSATIGPHRVLPGAEAPGLRLAVLCGRLPTPLADAPHPMGARRRVAGLPRLPLEREHLRRDLAPQPHHALLDAPARPLVHVQPPHRLGGQARAREEALLGVAQRGPERLRRRSRVQPPTSHGVEEDLPLGERTRLEREGLGRRRECGGDLTESRQNRRNLRVGQGHFLVQAHLTALLPQARLDDGVDAAVVPPNIAVLRIEDVQQVRHIHLGDADARRIAGRPATPHTGAVGHPAIGGAEVGP